MHVSKHIHMYVIHLGSAQKPLMISCWNVEVYTLHVLNILKTYCLLCWVLPACEHPAGFLVDQLLQGMGAQQFECLISSCAYQTDLEKWRELALTFLIFLCLSFSSILKDEC